MRSSREEEPRKIEQEVSILLDSWMCGDRVLVEQKWYTEREASRISVIMIGREPPGWKKTYEMYSMHNEKQSFLSDKGKWTFEEAEKEFELWRRDIEEETLEQNPEREVDKYCVEMFQYLFLHQKVREAISGFPSREEVTAFRKMVLAVYGQLTLIFKED